MELEAPDGSTIPITAASDTVIGRTLGLRRPSAAGDRTVSRCHLALRLLPTSVSFQVIGKNPILISSSSSSSSSSVPNRLYRRSESGELLPGDRISLSLTHPSSFLLKSTTAVDERVLDAVERRERRTRERQKDKERDDNIELDELDVSQIDAVEEFGFLVKGREFEKYGGRRVRPATDWDWFLEETMGGNGDGEEEEEGSKGKGRRRKKKGGKEEEEEEWIGESSNESGVSLGGGGRKRPKYTTRSRDPKKPCKHASKSLSEKDDETGKYEFEEEDEADETLGGFIIDDEEATEEEAREGEEEEELEDEDMSDED